jgi:hypothetical protein
MDFRDYSSSYLVLQEIILGPDVDACPTPPNLESTLAETKRLKRNIVKNYFLPAAVLYPPVCLSNFLSLSCEMLKSFKFTKSPLERQNTLQFCCIINSVVRSFSKIKFE